MSARARLVATGMSAGAISSTRSIALTEGWSLASTAPGAVASPADLAQVPGWGPAVVPGTVAAAVGVEDLDRHEDYDAADWWYRCSFERADDHSEHGPRRMRLRFDGLATLAEVWLNDELVLESTNMFCAHEVDVTDVLADDNELLICFRSLGAALAEKRPRPRWKTRLVEDQQLRWFRTTLLGRIPGWTPAIAPVGPWRPVWLESVSVVDVESLRLRTGVEGSEGTVDVRATLRSLSESDSIQSGVLRVDGEDYPLEVTPAEAGWSVTGTVRIPNPSLWWPATHGEPALHACELVLETSEGPVELDCGRVGFRSIALDTDNDRVQFVVNGVPVFARGSCWTSNDIVSLVGSPERMRRVVSLAAGANANMIRVGGTMVYESDDFYRACDELGVMVWQDFMFANMDYPLDDPVLAGSVRGETAQQLGRLSRHPCVVAYCGSSEVEQQAAMFGAPAEHWANDFFAVDLPELVEEHTPGTPYWPSTPTGGALPFHVGTGLAHYYGVGAYRRPLDDVRLAAVKFTPECLGFSNVPEAANLRALAPSGAVAPHDSSWKRGVPRDRGAGWDFEDVRDHYLGHLYGIDPVRLRCESPERYLELSRVVTGEVMASVFAEWRSPGDPCGGALTWFMMDLRPGAGWGLIDSDGEPKAALDFVRRAWAPRCVRLLDRGLDGLVVLIVNEDAIPLQATLQLLVVGTNGGILTETTQSVDVAGRASTTFSVEAAFGYFLDSTYSYRFGPPRHEALVARLIRARDGSLLSEDVYRPSRSHPPAVDSLEARIYEDADGALSVVLSTDRILYDVRIELRDHRATVNHFHLTPGLERSVPLRRESDAARPPRGYVTAANLDEARRIELG